MRQSFSFSPVVELDVGKSISQIKSNAISEDGIPLKFIKLLLPHLIRPLTHIINFCFMSSSFPDLWKVATVLPVAKKQNPCNVNDFRPISILSPLAKVAEKLMAQQITNYLVDKNLLSTYQSGFRSGHGCSSAMVKVIDDIRPEYDAGSMTLLCLLDFTKAFDKVNHQRLCSKLNYLFGFCDSAVNLMSSYLCNRYQKVKVGQLSSGYNSVLSGVPQGSILGPLLFSMFINDIFSVCNHASIHAYADDVQLYLSRRTGLIDDLCCRMNEDLCSISKWADINGLLLNSSKSYVLPICRVKTCVNDVSDLFIGPNKLTVVSKIVNLGFYVNSSLSCVDHVNSIVKKVYYILRNLRISANVTPVNIKRKLVIQLILPVITYSEVVYSKLDSSSMLKLQLAFNYATRYVYGLRKFDQLSSFRNAILGCNLTAYLNARNCMYLHKIIYAKTPGYLYAKVQFCMSRRSLVLIVPRHSSLISSRLFFINAIRLWNALPRRIREIIRRGPFRQSILSYFSTL